MLIHARFATIPILLALTACSSPAFDVKDRERFVQSCISSAASIAAAKRIDGNVVAELFAFAAKPEVPVEIERRFDAGRPPNVVGQGILARRNAAEACAGAFDDGQVLSGMSAALAAEVGLTRWSAAMTDQVRYARSTRDVIVKATEGIRRTQGGLSELIGKLSPRGIRFGILKRGQKSIPMVVIQAVNPLDRPIEAFFFGIDLRRPDGSVIASGRVTFKPAAPLGRGVETTYQVELEGVTGFMDPSLADLRENVIVRVKVEDVVSGGVRLLGDTLTDPYDATRIQALGILLGRIQDAREYAQRLREALQ